jgi:V8-like Glu-specific endopeptidase
MSWEDAGQLESRLNQALNAFDWQGAAGICNEIIERIKKSEDKIPENTARRLMASLRRKRRFTLMRELAHEITGSGVRAPQIRRQYAQALIDDGYLDEAEGVLNAIVQDPATNTGEIMEARGLIGRVYKQRYVNNAKIQAEGNAANLQRALELYYEAYRLNPQMNLWHGINAVALTARARRDGLSFEGMPDESALAREILNTIAEMEAQSVTGNLYAYDEATRMEAYVALGQYSDADTSALRYIDSNDADAFEIKSTIRQLEEVWQLSYNEPPGNHLLPLLKSTQLSKEGGFSHREPQKVAEESAAVGVAIKDLEAKFGQARTVTLIWYRKGLEQCNSVARIEKLNGTGHGTGWLVNASDFFHDREGVLLLTNEHVISDTPDHPKAIFPEDARANFQATGEILKLKEIVWSSPYTDLDATFVTLEKVPKAPPLVLHERAVRMPQPPTVSRLYIIGHPMGGDLQFSIEDNHLLGCNDTLLHYRTPTEPGSSGSPVFESEDWRVVALHHGGSKSLTRLDGVSGTYEANEGIAIRAIKRRIQGS